MNDYRKRQLTAALEKALRAFPVVVLTGARQTGKTTLAQHLRSSQGRAYRTLDDLRVLDLAQREPDLLVAEAERMTLDEVQRVPDLLRAVKRAVDRRRSPGRYLLTGSANLLLMSAVSETLAGRAVYLRLGPMTEAEKAQASGSSAWGDVLRCEDATAASRVLSARSPLRVDWPSAVCEGGMPPLLGLDAEDRHRWLEGYVSTYLERDLQQLSAIQSLADFRRLLAIAAQRVGGLLNRAELARDAALSRPSAHRYVDLLEVSYQLRLLAPYARNRTKRLVKTPKLYFTDTGLAAHLAGIMGPDEIRALPARGAWLESLLLVHIDAWRETLAPRPEVYFWRTADGAEIDFVVEQGRRLLPVEVKAGARVDSGDLKQLGAFCDEYREARFGMLVYGGTEVYVASPRVVAVPYACLL